MKVLVLYENEREQLGAARLAAVLNTAGGMLANAVATPNLGGIMLRVEQGPQWSIQALSGPFEALASRNPFSPKYTQPRPKRGVRELIFPEEDE